MLLRKVQNVAKQQSNVVKPQQQLLKAYLSFFSTVFKLPYYFTLFAFECRDTKTFLFIYKSYTSEVLMMKCFKVINSNVYKLTWKYLSEKAEVLAANYINRIHAPNNISIWLISAWVHLKEFSFQCQAALWVST